MNLLFLLLLLLPLFAGELLHVGHGVFFVNNLGAEHGFDNVLHGHDAAETAVFVDDDGNMLFLSQQLLPYFAHVLVLLESENWTYDVGKAQVEFVFGELFEYGLTQHIALYVVVVLLVVDGNA